MLIDIPVTIKFDCESKSAQGPLDHTRVFTMRYDTDPDAKVLAQYTVDYPPRANAHWLTDNEGVLFDLLTSGADKAIKKAAEADPETYCSDPAEGETLQEAADEAAAAHGQFGVGA